MSESVHAVVAKGPQHHQSDHHNRQNHPPLTRTDKNTSVMEDEDDDDIDIIGKFGHSTQQPQSQSMSFMMTGPTSSTSAGSNHQNFMLSNAPFSGSNINNSSFRLLDNQNVLLSPPTVRSSNGLNLSPFIVTPEPPPSTRQRHISQDYSGILKRDDPTQASLRHQSRASLFDSQSSAEDEWTTDGNFTPSRDRLRRALRYYFMSPMDKWKIKGRFPWKLLFQIVKIILVTSQLIIFGNNVTDYKSADNSMLVSLHNLFLLDWDTSRDFKIVPPESGPYAVYTKDDVYRHLDYAIKNYANISALTVGSFGYQLKRESTDNTTADSVKLKIEACFHRYTNATLNPSIAEYFIDTTPFEQCVEIDTGLEPGSDKWANFSFSDYIQRTNPEQNNFESLLQLSLKLPLRAILLNTIIAYNTPQCFDLDVLVNFDNKAHSGEINIKMITHTKLIDCYGNLEDHVRETRAQNMHIAVNVMVLLLCIISLLLCVRSLWRGQSLRRRTIRFFALAYRRNLEAQSMLHFIDGWIIMILINDCLLITGTSINLLRQLSVLGPHKLSLRPADFDNICSALLGVGNLLVWCGVLRYLAFFSKYNVLIVTLKHAFPRVLRFLFCVLVLYSGFCFSGWIILGPYHFKFQTLARTSECLFALMNGDDVFATFAYLQHSSPFVWWFSRLYLYTFVLLFIYVVLSLFIAILMDSYETIKDYYTNRKRKLKGGLLFSNDQLARFIASGATEDEDDNWSSYRLNLLHDEEAEFQHNSRQRYASGASGDIANCPCCICHCWSHLATPFGWLRNAFASFRGKFSRQTVNSEETRNLTIN